MKAEKAIFITGATGLVGGFWTLTALRAGHSVRLLVRGKLNRSPQERIQQALGLFGYSPEEWSSPIPVSNLRRRYRPSSIWTF
jgi:thioester reductase-like protein